MARPALFSTFFLLFATLFLSSCSDDNKSASAGELLAHAAAAAEKGQWRDALKLAKSSVKRNPKDVNAMVMLALAFEQNGESQQAVDSLHSATKLAPDSFPAQFNLGRILFGLGKYEDCVAPLKNAKDLDPEDVDTLILLAKTTDFLNLPESAEYYQILTTSKRFQNRPEPFNELGVFHVKRNDLKRASNYFIKAYKAAPQNYQVVYNLGVFLDKHMNTPEKAKKFYMKYLELTAKNPELDELRQKVQSRLGATSSAPAAASDDSQKQPPQDQPPAPAQSKEKAPQPPPPAPDSKNLTNAADEAD